MDMKSAVMLCAVRFSGKAVGVAGAVDKTEVFGADEVFRDPFVREPVLVGRVVNVASEDRDSVG